MPKFEALLYDFDDTLTMTEPACFEMENEALAEQGKRPMSREIHLATWGQPLFEAIKARSPGVEVDAFRRDLIRIHEEWIRNGHIDVIDQRYLKIIHEFGELGITQAVVTSRTEDEAKHLLVNGHDLRELMHEIYHSDATVHKKPDARVFDLFFRHHPHIRRERTAYIGDAPSDEEAVYAAKLGHAFITLESGIRVPDNFRGGPKTTFLKDLTELPQYVW